MENQRVLLFKQKNRWGLTALSIALSLLVIPALGMSVLMPQTLVFLPILLLLLLGYVGPVSTVVCSALMVGLTGWLFGLWGALSALLFLMPLLIASTVTVEERRAFWPSVGISAAAMFISMGAVMLLLSLIAGNDIVTAFGNMMRQALESLGALGDPMLLLMAQRGYISVPEALSDTALMTGQTLDAASRTQMIQSLVFLLDGGLRLELPAQMAAGSLAAGVLGQAVLRRGVLSRGVQLPYEPLRTWRLPKGWGRILGGTLAVFLAGSMLLPERLSAAYYVFSAVFQLIFMLQGIAALCYLLHEHGKGRRWEALVFAAGYFLLGVLAMLVGIADQAFDFTHRREALDKGNNPYDPFHSDSK